jgi:hypothetical protein
MKIQITVGTSTDKNNQPLSPEFVSQARDSAEIELLTYWCNGFTRTQGVGAWNDGAAVIRDNVLIYTFLLEDGKRSTDECLRGIGDLLRDAFHQSCVVRELLTSFHRIS